MCWYLITRFNETIIVIAKGKNREIYNYRVFNPPLSLIDSISRKTINSNITYLNNTVNQNKLAETLGHFTQQHILFKRVLNITNMDMVLNHKQTHSVFKH